MNKPVYLGLPILDLSKTIMYEFMYDYAKPKYGENAKLRYMGTDSCIAHVKTEDIYKEIAKEVETRFDTLNLELGRLLLKGKNKKVIRLMKDKLGGEIMIKFVRLTAKNYSYLTDEGTEDKTAKG